MPTVLTLYPRSALKVPPNHGRRHPLRIDSMEAEQKIRGNSWLYATRSLGVVHLDRAQGWKRTRRLKIHFANGNGIPGINKLYLHYSSQAPLNSSRSL